MAKIRVTQIKSSIERPKTQRFTLKALGLKRIGSTAEHEAIPSILRMVNKAEHLISVEKVK